MPAGEARPGETEEELWFAGVRTYPGETAESGGKGGVADGTRTRNNQNHNLGIYH